MTRDKNIGGNFTGWGLRERLGLSQAKLYFIKFNGAKFYGLLKFLGGKER